MSFPDLQSFIKALDEHGQLRRISAEVDPVLEISAISDRVSRLPAVGSAATTPVCLFKCGSIPPRTVLRGYMASPSMLKKLLRSHLRRVRRDALLIRRS